MDKSTGHPLKKQEINLTEGAYLPKILAFVIPVIISGLLQMAFNMTDSVVVGKLVNDQALGAVTSTTPLFSLITNLFLGISIGSNVLVARYFGAGAKQEVSKVVHTSVLAALILGGTALLIGTVFTEALLKLMKCPDDVLASASVYLRVIFLAAPGNLMYHFLAAMMRAVGDTKRPMIFLFLAVLLNIGLDLLFVLAFHWDVFGVALATAISQMVAGVITLVTLIREDGILMIRLRALRIDPSKLKQIFRVGAPAGIQSALLSTSNVFIQSAVNSFGDVAMAGIGAAYQIENLVYYSIYAFQHSALDFISQNVGAQRFDRIRKGLLVNLAAVTLLCLVLGIGSYLAGPKLLSLFTVTEEAIRFGMLRMALVIAPYFLVGWMETMSGAVRGLGASLTPTFVTLFGSCVFRIIWTLWIFPMNPTMEMLLYIYPISWGIVIIGHSAAFVFFYRRMKRHLPDLHDRTSHLEEGTHSVLRKS